MCEAARAEWNVEWHERELPEALRQRAQELADTKYSRDEYNCRR
jgi:hypothetical protein